MLSKFHFPHAQKTQIMDKIAIKTDKCLEYSFIAVTLT